MTPKQARSGIVTPARARVSSVWRSSGRLGEAVAIMAADDRVGQVHGFDLGLQLATVLLGDFAAERLTVILFGWPIVQLTSSRRSPSLSSAAMKKYLLVSINDKVDCFSYGSCYAFAPVVEGNTIPILMLFTAILRFSRE